MRSPNAGIKWGIAHGTGSKAMGNDDLPNNADMGDDQSGDPKPAKSKGKRRVPPVGKIKQLQRKG